MLLFALTIFLSAFLLFQVQPVMGRFVLPWFGGGPSVWTVCMLFFQMLLLGGYTYAHVIRTRLSQRGQALVHVALLAAAMLALRSGPSAAWKPTGEGDPTWQILWVLAATVGLPYLALAATGPLLQAWFSSAYPGRSPYRLYALSNVGSLLALVSYPFVVEPLLGLRTQCDMWGVGFGAFAVLCVVCGVRMWRAAAPVSDGPSEDGPAPGWGTRLLWLALAACGSTLLLAVTNQMCWDVAVVPFLWVLPLSVYLVTFILCFDSSRWYRRGVFWPLLGGGVATMLWLMEKGVGASILSQVVGYSVGLFACCMVCHGELVRLKPSPRRLTSFYLMVSAGGAVGGVFVSLVAPHVFVLYLELHIGIWACVGLGLLALWRERRPRVASAVAGCVALAGLAVLLGGQAASMIRNPVSMSRNFYGVLQVGLYGSKRGVRCHVLKVGRINHGCQYLDEVWRRRPVMYFPEHSGVGLALRQAGAPKRVGVLGLGVGALAAYGEAGDTIVFYEINPEVVRLARTHFTYLADCKARESVVLGDARLSLERQPPQAFDVLAMDAFSGDAVPVHLLTREAFNIYLRHLSPSGVIAVNVTNRFVDLLPVMKAHAAHFGLHAEMFVTLRSRVWRSDDCTWVLLTRDGAVLEREAFGGWPLESIEDVTPVDWTDDYCNLFRVLKRH